MNDIQELDFSHRTFIDKTTILYGPSGTGKSFIINDILYLLKDHIDQIMVFSPTDKQNNLYCKSTVPLPCIHYTITADVLENIWKRQEALSTVYTTANQLEIIKRLFFKIPNTQQIQATLDNMKERLQKYCDELDETENSNKIVEMKAEYEKIVNNTYKKYITDNREFLNTQPLSDAEKHSLKYMNLNPRLILIFDDCTDVLKEMKNNGIIKKIFFQGRWQFITALISCHSDVTLLPEIRNSSFINIFTHPIIAKDFYGKTKLDKETARYIEAAIRDIFVPAHKHQKMAVIRDTMTAYKYTATKHEDFRFGSKYIWDYCEAIKQDGTGDPHNKFMRYFT